MHFDGKRLVLKRMGGEANAIGLDGMFCMQKDEMTMLVEPGGRFGKRVRGEWQWFDPDGNVVFLRNLAAKKRRMVRQDHIEYSIFDDGRCLIVHCEDFSIVQADGQVTFDVPNFPSVEWSRNSLSFVVGTTKFAFGDQVRVTDPKFGAVLADGRLRLDFGQVSMDCGTQELHIGCADYEVRGDASGSHFFRVPAAFGPAQLFERLPARLFAVHSDLSVMEFLRDDSRVLQEAEAKTSRIDSQGRIMAMTAHFQDPEKDPLVFLSYMPMRDRELQKVVADVEAAVEAPGDPDLEQANAARAALSDSFAKIEDVMRTRLSADHGKIVMTRIQQPITTKKGRNICPPPSVPPRRMEAKHFKDDPRVTKIRPGEVVNYWKCHESDFAMAELK
jgi:hypothetical protein